MMILLHQQQQRRLRLPSLFWRQCCTWHRNIQRREFNAPANAALNNRLCSTHDVVASSPTSKVATATSKATTVYSSLSSPHHLEYARGWAWQQILLHERLHQMRRQRRGDNSCLNSSDDDNAADNNDDEQPPDAILLLEHAPVYTLGRGADEGHISFPTREKHDDDDIGDEASKDRQRLSRTSRGPGSARLAMDKIKLDFGNKRNQDLSTTTLTTAAGLVDELLSVHLQTVPVTAPNGVPIYRIDRGGEVTFHGPGQLVVYPLLDLKKTETRQADLHWYLRQVEQVIIDTLCDHGIDAAVRDDEHTGVWVGDKKVAAVGVSATRWITTHGFALNVHPDLSYFDARVILPCGIVGRGVTSMHEILSSQGGAELPTVPEVAQTVLKHMERVFGVNVDTKNVKDIR